MPILAVVIFLAHRPTRSRDILQAPSHDGFGRSPAPRQIRPLAVQSRTFAVRVCADDRPTARSNAARGPQGLENMTSTAQKSDPFAARDTFDTGTARRHLTG